MVLIYFYSILFYSIKGFAGQCRIIRRADYKCNLVASRIYLAQDHH